MDKVEMVFDKVETALEKHNANPVVVQITGLSEKAGLARSKFTVAAAVAVVLLIVLMCGMELVATIVGVTYPTMASIDTMKSGNVDDAKRWLTYWIIFGGMMVLGNFSGVISFWIPIFNELQIAFLAYCQAPIDHNGAQVIYDKVFKPMVDNASASTSEEKQE